MWFSASRQKVDWDLVSCTTEQNYCSRRSKTQYTIDEQPGDTLHFNSLGHFVRDTGTSSELQESSASSSPPPTPSHMEKPNRHHSQTSFYFFTLPSQDDSFIPGWRPMSRTQPRDQGSRRMPSSPLAILTLPSLQRSHHIPLLPKDLPFWAFCIHNYQLWTLAI